MTKKAFFENILGLRDPKVVAKLVNTSRLAKVSKGEIVVELYEMQQDLMFVVDGVLRGSCIDAQGREYTDCFAVDCGAPILASMSIGEPATIRIEALKDTEMIFIPITTVQELLQESLEVNHLYIALLTESLRKHWELKMIFYRYSAGEKYQWFLDHYPQLASLVPQKHIATYLHMTPETLSEEKRKRKQQQEI